ncbi:phosphotransferase [Paraburkholderia tuberum]|uniref:Phosphotransferase enzyme family protein n=1 Tax=Paraburkholderia tuberum TaxID=157910 RepID=A0A1H1KHW6_9BURK|nr:phosphotransferase [Paraburkholderia tuberum]SDR61672.1 Phosphotransferase enzyme family protein [Paraburkholderia tuberum]
MVQQFNDLFASPEQLSRILSAMGLVDRDEIPQVTPLTGGVSSGIMRVDVRKGSFCVKQALPQLKVEKLWEVPLERAFYEVEWLRTVAKIRPGSVPKVIGEDRQTASFVMEYFDKGYVNWKSDLLDGKIDVNAASQVGDILGLIHERTANDPEIARRFATDDNFYAIRLEPYLVEAARIHKEVQPQLEALVRRTRDHRVALVHGDVSPKNVLLGPNGPVLLDAECAWYGDPAFDLAFVLNHLLIKAWRDPKNASALLASFDALSRSYFRHITFESPFDLEWRAVTLLPALTLARIDGKSPVEYLKATEQQQLREVALALIKTPLKTLHELNSFWKNCLEHYHGTN